LPLPEYGGAALLSSAHKTTSTAFLGTSVGWLSKSGAYEGFVLMGQHMIALAIACFVVQAMILL
jgi:hypothetical protein